MQTHMYSSIGQFRNAVKDVRYLFDGQNLPTLTFSGTVKVHGTNASVVVMPDGTQYYQSRKRIITPEDDNYGFAAWASEREYIFHDCAMLAWDRLGAGFEHQPIIIYGEWAGKGIQAGVAVSELERFFYIFGIKSLTPAGDSFWLKHLPVLGHCDSIITSREVRTYNMDIDFRNPGMVQNDLAELTEEVEKHCPVGAYMGVDGVGEGIVWEHINPQGQRISFKVKGEKHSVTKVKRLAKVDTEKLKSIEEFLDYAITENRLRQGFSEVCNNTADRKLLGTFIKWVSNDVRKEESDTMEDNDLTMKDIGKGLSLRAKDWFFAQEDM